MQLAILELEIFSGLIVLLGAIFVALICDFLKGNNEQLRERNVELRARQEERDKLGIFQNPMQWIQALADALRPQMPAETAPEAGPVAAAQREAESFTPLRRNGEAENGHADPEGGPMRRRMYDEMKARSQQTSPWASKEELEQLAERAARIRARHESHKTHDDRVKQETEAKVAESIAAAPHESAPPPAPEPEPVMQAEPVTAPPPVVAAPPPVAAAPPAPPRPQPRTEIERPRPVVRVVGSSAMLPVLPPEPAPPVPESLLSFDQAKPGFRTTTSMPAYVPELAQPPAPAEPPAPAREESNTEIANLRVLPIDRNAPDRYEGPVETAPLDLESEILRVAEAESTAPAAQEPVPAQEPAPAPVAAPAPPPVEEESKPTTTVMVPALAAAIEEAAAREKPVPAEIPSGLHEGSVLRTLIETGMQFSGVAVAIGINDSNGLKEKLAATSGLDSIGALNRMVQSMLRPQDFACQFAEDEFILLYPGESGPSAQRRLFQVSEKLWDFQLRSLGHLSVMFSWGGLEVQNERLTEAVASARERMYQTRRNRKPGASDTSQGGRKRVANG